MQVQNNLKIMLTPPQILNLRTLTLNREILDWKDEPMK